MFSHVFRDRLQTQEEISQLLVNVFSEKQRINYDEYSNVNETVTSEMFLSLMTLLQTNLPCSINYFRYKTNYENYMDKDGAPQSREGDKKVTIASPSIVSRLSPVTQFAASAGINVNPSTQKHLLKYAKKAPKEKRE